MARRYASLFEFQRRFPDEASCALFLSERRWPDGFTCPECGRTRSCLLKSRAYTYECASCGRQTSVTVGISTSSSSATTAAFIGMFPSRGFSDWRHTALPCPIGASPANRTHASKRHQRGGIPADARPPAACVRTVPNLLMSTKHDYLGQRDKPWGGCQNQKNNGRAANFIR